MEAERVSTRRTPPVLGLYDLARCHAAIEAVERRDKPVAEIPIAVSVAQLGQLIDDVMRVAELTETGEIRVHVDYREGVALVAFYRYGWCREALAFLKKGGGCPPPALHWFQGLLFGYDPESIERFVRATEWPVRASTLRPRTDDTVGRFRAC
jgi:hypothetical protein